MADPQIVTAFQPLNLAFAARGVIGERMQDIESLFAINLPQLLLARSVQMNSLNDQTRATVPHAKSRNFSRCGLLPLRPVPLRFPAHHRPAR
jgi:hypothetical protein